MWRFVTGDREAIRAFASRFGVSIMTEGRGGTDITHNLRTAVVDADGRIVHDLQRKRLDAGRAARRVETCECVRRLTPRRTRSAPPVGAVAPPLSAFTPAERRVVRRLRTPGDVQRYLNALPYNTEPAPEGATLRSFRGVVRHDTAHCLEAALAAAVILEQHGWPPLVLSFESIDELDHVIFVYRQRGRWGSIARSRDPGLHGRRAVFATPRALALSYVDPYVDFTGRVTGYTVVDLRDIGNYDWRLAEGNVWKVERMLLNLPHRRAAHVERAHRPAAQALSRVPRHVRAQAGLLQAQGSVDGAARVNSEY